MFPDKIKRLSRGDPCPCCGQPIQTDDPFTLGVISALAELLDLNEIDVSSLGTSTEAKA